MATLRSPVVKRENARPLPLVKEENRVCVDLDEVGLHFTESLPFMTLGES